LRAIARQLGLHRRTVRSWLHPAPPPTGGLHIVAPVAPSPTRAYHRRTPALVAQIQHLAAQGLSYVYTTLPSAEWGMTCLFTFYNERTTIEALGGWRDAWSGCRRYRRMTAFAERRARRTRRDTRCPGMAWYGLDRRSNAPTATMRTGRRREMDLSARNQLAGTVTDVKLGGSWPR